MTDPSEDDAGPPALFDVGAAVSGGLRPGRAETSLRRALQAGAADGTIRDVDEALGEAALIAARALDLADRTRQGYLVAQSLPGYMKALHALRLPAEIAPVPAPLPAGGGGGAASWPDDLDAIFGTAE